MPIALPHARSAKLRALAVTGARRTPLVPEMPTVAEAGMPGYALDNWWGILAPHGVPPDLVVKLNALIVRIHGLADVKERYAGLGVEAVSSTPERFAEYIEAEAARFGKLLKDAGAKID